MEARSLWELSYDPKQPSPPHLPNLYRPILTGRSDTGTIGRPGHREHNVSMTSIGLQGLVATGIPHSHHPVIAARGNRLAIGRPGRRLHSVSLTGIGQ